jgi:hypothetical protein
MELAKVALCLCLLFALINADGKCKVFSCGPVSQPSEETAPRVCVQGAEGEENRFNSVGCKEGTFCQAFKWNVPTDATGPAECGNEAPTFFWGQWDPIDRKGLDGDYCAEDTHCYESDNNKPTCTGNKCKASTNEESACSDARDCPVGHTCTADQCTKLNGKDSTCEREEQCDFFLTCVKLDGDEEFKCIEQYSLTEGQRFSQPTQLKTNSSNAEPSDSIVCETGFEFASGETLQCRSGRRNAKQGRENLARDLPGDTCEIQIFDNESLDDHKTPSKSTSTAACGFNPTDKAFCPMQLGDDEILNAQKKAFSQQRGHKCHIQSGEADEGSICADLLNWQRSNDGWNFFLTFMLAQGDNNFALLGNNDQCVANTINVNFWENHFGDGANGAFTVVSIFLATTVSFLG